ncbi:histidine kinase [Chitinophaga pendula]|uniref:ligand-binding sensor domain-containing protein n=1 Tax=Chitinophaga TaxID=79328 RepID=UPI000BAFC9C8|nr:MULTISPECIES: two-component regulator propeller domain-containing protein [Chitinophaga]ASZ11880.1 histidine kinase [Chitinophaga sp. MD30]UCJ05095.1 histidine kinase [Chitinophaga pendula]
MKSIPVYFLCLMSVVHTSCGQHPTNAPKGPIKTKTTDTTIPRVPKGLTRNIKKASNGDILVASLRAVFRYHGKSFTNLTSNISSPSFWDVLEDRKGHLWLSTRDSGVYYYNGKSFQHFTTRQGLPMNQALAIYEDKAGHIWFGSGGGASRYDGKSFRNFTTKDGLSNNDVNVIIEDQTGKFWFGTRGNACIYDGKTFTILTHEGQPFRNVRSIIKDKKGNIWLGGSDGLWRYDGHTFTKLTQHFIGNIYEDSKGNIWTTSERNPYETGWTLSRYDQKSLYDQKPTVTEITSIKKMLCGILEAPDGSIWFGSIDGVYRYDGKNITNFNRC